MIYSILKYLPLIFTCFKGFIDNEKHHHKIRNYDQTKEKINTIEHLIIKLEKKLSECRNEIDDLRRHIMVSRVINIIFGILIIFLVIFMNK